MNLRIHIRYLFAVLWLIIPLALYGQSDETNSQKQARGINKEDTSKLNLLLKMSNELLNSKPSEAFNYAHEAYDLAQDSDDPYYLGLSCYAVAKAYRVTAVYDKALNYSLMALKNFEKIKDTVNVAGCYQEIGMIHMEAGDFKEANVNFNKSLELNKLIRNNKQIANNHMNIGLNYLKADSVDKGLSYFLVSYIIADSLGLKNEKIALMKNIGYAYARLGFYEEALVHFYKVLELLGTNADDYTRSDAQINIAKGYFRLKNYPAALKYARDGFELSQKKHFNIIYRDAAELLSAIYAQYGSYKQAYEYGKIYSNISDTIMNEEKAEQLARIQTIYDVNIKEEENVSLRQEIIQVVKRMRTRTFAVIIITTLAIVLSASLFLLSRMNKKQIALNKKLEAQSRELEALNELKDKFFSFVAHNLKNPFNTIMGFSELLQRSAETKELAKTKEYAGLIHDLSSQVQKVLSNLLEWSRIQRRSFEVKPETVELTGLIKDIVEMNNKEAARKDIELNISNDGAVFVVVDRTMITAVIQNLVNNAIQYTPPSGRISIDCKANDQRTEVIITDTGIGIPADKLAKLFDFDFSQAKLGSSDHGGSGLGLVICHEMLLKNGGSIHAKSEPGKGSSFMFTLPVAIRHDLSNVTNDHDENTPVEVAEKLLLSVNPMGENMRSEITAIVVPLFNEVSKALSIENLESLARVITNIGEKYNDEALTNYGRSLNTLTTGHQIDQIIKIIPKFKEYLNNRLIV